jgi:hypothetical protein
MLMNRRRAQYIDSLRKQAEGGSRMLRGKRIFKLPVGERGLRSFSIELISAKKTGRSLPAFLPSHFARLLPDTILYSSKRHSIAPLNSGMRFDGDNRISFRMALSAVNR